MFVPVESQRPERVVTAALLGFLCAVAAILALAGYWRWSPVTLADATRALADGDVDGPQRPAMLRRVVVAAADSEDLAARWAGLFAAIALDDREAYERAMARLGPGPAPAAMPADRTFLDLGDPTLGNLGAAMWAEAAGDREAARRSYRQVEAQCRLAPRPLAAELAAAGIARLQ